MAYIFDKYKTIYNSRFILYITAYFFDKYKGIYNSKFLVSISAHI